MATQSYDLIIIGSGPIGLACGIEAKKNGLSYLILEKGVLLDAVYRFPTNCIFFSTPELVEIGDIPFLTNGPKPTRTELLRYYTKVAEFYNLNFRLRTRVENVEKQDGIFSVQTEKGEKITAKAVVLATGFFDHPNLLEVSGENMEKVSHYYTESHLYYRTKVAVIGGQNSAVEAALELYRAGAEVTLIHRQAQVGRSVKYWIQPDIENRIKEGSIPAYFNTVVQEIQPDKIVVKTEGGAPLELENDFVLAMTGYHPDFDLLRRAGVEIHKDGMIPVYDKQTMQTNVPGLYLAGVVAGGVRDANRIFIENGRVHAKYVVEHFISANN